MLVVLVAFVLGLAAGAFWLYHTPNPPAAPLLEAAATPALSDATKAVLQHLDSPVTIRVYALLDPASVPAALRDFAGRVDQLLAEYEREGKGKLKILRYQTLADTAANAAAADKIKPFNLDKGDACYLGLAVACRDQQESLPQLLPEWEQALESDLTRTLVRVIKAQPRAAGPVETSPPDPAVLEEVRRTLPDLASVSIEEGTRRLREKARVAFAAATGEMETRVKEAQQRIIEAQNSGSETATQAAVQELQRLQAEHMEKLKKIAAQAHAQVVALEQIKKQ